MVALCSRWPRPASVAVLFVAIGCRHVSTERCVAFEVRGWQCELPNDKVSDADRERLRGAYCATDTDRDHVADKVSCVNEPTCEAFDRCAYPDGHHASPFGLPR